MTPELSQAYADVTRLEAAITWVLNDMKYKAPEQVAGCTGTWAAVLASALAKREGG